MDTAELDIGAAIESDAADLFALRCRAAESLTMRHGVGHWSATGTVRGVAQGILSGRTLVARASGQTIGAVSLQARKPWAIDVGPFTPARRAVYLVDMRVDPARQGQGVGRRLMQAVIAAARAWPADAIRLDAYASPAGAGPFYEKCGFREVARVVYRTVPLIYFELTDL